MLQGKRAALSMLCVASVGLACAENTYVAPPLPEVTVQTPEVREVIDYLAYTGRARAVESVQVQARVKGYLQSMHYTPGTDVKKGDLLFVIDPKPFEVEVAARQAELSSRQAEAKLTQTRYERSRQLYRQKATSEIEFLREQAERDKASAAVLAAEAALADAELDLDYAYVKSPIDGRAGRHQVDIGNLVGADETTLLADVVDYSPLFVYFQISELDVLRIKRQIRARNSELAPGETPEPRDTGMAEETLETAESVEAEALDAEVAEIEAIESHPAEAEPADSEPLSPSAVGYEASGGTRYGRSPGANVPPIQVGLADEAGYPHEGFLDFAASYIDEATGTLELRGVLENKGAFEAVILPGSFLRVRIAVGKFEDAMLVPDLALGSDQGGRFLLVVGEGDVVEQRYVQVADTYDGMRRIVSGIKPGERIVVNGLQRARPGAKVTPKATPEATSQVTPKATPEATSQVTPKATPEAASQVMPEATPEATSQVTPKATPEATSQVMSEAAPRAAESGE